MQGILTSGQHLLFLQDYVISMIIRLFPNNCNPNLPAEQICFQQDRAPEHFERVVRQYIEEICLGKWIESKGAIEKAAMSPDMSPLKFCVWSLIKNFVYENRPQNIEDLHQSVIHIPPKILLFLIQNRIQRTYYRHELNYEHFEHLIKWDSQENICLLK